jgi:Spy/CpxP family protein refolding chaperone
MTRSKLGAVLLLLGVFALGAVAGGVGLRMAEGGKGPRHGGREGYIERLTSALDLTAVQQDSIRTILERGEPLMDSLWHDVRPRFDSLRVALRAEIRAQLTPEQQRRYTEMLERRDREYRQRRSNGRK